MPKLCNIFTLILFLLTASLAYASTDKTVDMAITSDTGSGEPVGTITITQTKYGLLFTPHLSHLTPGIHGLHIHENASCDQNGMAAGGHLDPKKTGKHLGPYNDLGHLGDLPAIYVNADGTADLPVLAPRLKNLSVVKNHTLMVHAGGDNYSDTPEKLGGGGSRMICGVIN